MHSTSSAPARNGDRRATTPGLTRTLPRERRQTGSAAVTRATRELPIALGADLSSEGLRDTPRRMAAAYLELLAPEPFNMTMFSNEEGYDELVLVRDIPFQFVCMHHVLPFHGVAHIAYLPADRILGLSKLARVVDLFARDLQLQERLTVQIGACLQLQLRPRAWVLCSRPSISACRCAEPRSPEPRQSPRRCPGSSVTIPARARNS
jgi:GTP cyclohydrolase I